MNNKLIAEGIGTMVLVLMGCGSAVLCGGATSVSGILTIAFAFGLSVVAMAYCIGHISGCHINPAITLGVWLNGGIKAKEALAYMGAQVIGAVTGSAILFSITSTLGINGTGANVYVEGAMVPALIAEVVFTFIFVFIALGTTSNGAKATSGFAGLAIGLSLVLVHIVCIPITGTSVNPARSIGPALFEGGEALAQLWLFVLAPFIGAVVAAVVWNLFEKK